MLLKAAGFYAHSGTPATSTTSRRGSQSPVDLGGQRKGSSLMDQIIDAVELDGDCEHFRSHLERRRVLDRRQPVATHTVLTDLPDDSTAVRNRFRKRQFRGVWHERSQPRRLLLLQIETPEQKPINPAEWTRT
jgi:hypothetical protein